jgi:hypothetical protein
LEEEEEEEKEGEVARYIGFCLEEMEGELCSVMLSFRQLTHSP